MFLKNRQLEEQRDSHLYCDAPAFPFAGKSGATAGPTDLQMRRARHIFTSSAVGSSSLAAGATCQLLTDPAGTRPAALPNNGRGQCLNLGPDNARCSTP